MNAASPSFQEKLDLGSASKIAERVDMKMAKMDWWEDKISREFFLS